MLPLPAANSLGHMPQGALAGASGLLCLDMLASGGTGADEASCLSCLQVLLDGTDVSLLQAKSLRSKIGVVSQEPLLLATDIVHNITLGR